MRDELIVYPRPMAVRANMSVLRTAADIAMRSGVLLFAQGNRLKSLSLGASRLKEKQAFVERFYVVLGVFRADAGETCADVYRRLYDEAAAVGWLPLSGPEM